jgi:hypothetical protein
MGDFEKLGGALGAGLAGLFIVKTLSKELKKVGKYGNKDKKIRKKNSHAYAKLAKFNKRTFIRK